MKIVLVAFILILIFIEVSFIAYDIIRRRFTKRLKDNHREVFVRLGSPSRNWSVFTEFTDDQIALTTQAKYIRTAGYRELNDRKITFFGDYLRRLFFAQLIFGFCLFAIVAILFQGAVNF